VSLDGEQVVGAPESGSGSVAPPVPPLELDAPPDEAPLDPPLAPPLAPLLDPLLDSEDPPDAVPPVPSLAPPVPAGARRP
jgi:hypothetical protein